MGIGFMRGGRYIGFERNGWLYRKAGKAIPGKRAGASRGFLYKWLTAVKSHKRALPVFGHESVCRKHSALKTEAEREDA
jgi:hypothetical protein